MHSATVNIDSFDGIVCVSIQRPTARNAVDPATAQALYDAFCEFEQDDQAKVAILTGSEGSFCAGFDLTSVQDAQSNWLQQLHWGDNGQPPVGPMGPSRMQLSKPVIAAIEGPAVAGGMELAAWCDLRVMAEDAYMGVYCRRWGVPLIDGGTVRLPRLIGLSRAQDLIMTGRQIDAQECLGIGLANRVVPSGKALSAALALARQLLAFPQGCMNADRQSAKQSYGDERSALQAEFAAGMNVVADEAIPGAKQFADGAGRHGLGMA